jgi:exodeoxyribonuclease VII large subunit
LAALRTATTAVVLRNRALLDQQLGRLEALSPLAILERGYALVFDASGQLVKDASRLQGGDDITARVAQGTIRATVKS